MNYRYVPSDVDDEGYIINGYSEWDCNQCGAQVRRYRGSWGVDCPECGACYNASGQRLRDDWRDNPSCWDDDISDMDGYEIQHAND